MSAKISGLIWDLDIPRPEKYVFHALADHAKHDGTDVYPSIDLLRYKTGYEKRQIQVVISNLVQSKLLILVHQGGRGPKDPNVYRINLQEIAKRQRNYDEWLRRERQATRTSASEAENASLQPGSDTAEDAKNAPITEPVRVHSEVAKGAVSSEKRVHPSAHEVKTTTVEPSYKKPARKRRAVGDDSPVDSRHAEVEKFIKQTYAAKNPGRQCSWSGTTGALLKTLLKTYNTWSIEDFEKAILNRYASVGIAPAQEPVDWILPRNGAKPLSDYLSGPLGKFKSFDGKPSGAEAPRRLSASERAELDNQAPATRTRVQTAGTQ